MSGAIPPGVHEGETISGPVEQSGSRVGAAEGTSTTIGAKILRDLDQLATLSHHPDRIDRFHLTTQHAAANALVAQWMQAAGMSTWIDAAGNQCGRLEGCTPGLPALLLGSHIDTVPDAGRYDGPLGVALAVSAVAQLAPRAADLPFALEVIAFSDEEGVRFGCALMGSRAVAGTWDESWWELEDEHGISVRQAFTDFGLDPERVAQAARTDLVGYLEAHIEQGPLLEEQDLALGVVTSIAGAARFSVTMHGQARHAGGTPYHRRRDALVAASQAVLEIERIGREREVVATVGRLEAFPGAVNVVPGRVEFSLDVRAADDSSRDAAVNAIREAMDQICQQRQVTYQLHADHLATSVACAPELMNAVAAGISAAGQSQVPQLFSRAGHDGMSIAAVAPIGMLFVRCHDGISHHPQESVTPADVDLAHEAFVAAIDALAREQARA